MKKILVAFAVLLLAACQENSQKEQNKSDQQVFTVENPTEKITFDFTSQKKKPQMLVINVTGKTDGTMTIGIAESGKPLMEDCTYLIEPIGEEMNAEIQEPWTHGTARIELVPGTATQGPLQITVKSL